MICPIRGCNQELLREILDTDYVFRCPVHGYITCNNCIHHEEETCRKIKITQFEEFEDLEENCYFSVTCGNFHPKNDNVTIFKKIIGILIK